MDADRTNAAGTAPIIPAPWKLTGSGWIVLFHAGRSFIRQHAHLPAAALPQARSGIGALMIVRYRSSPVGPYDELLCMPARLGGLRLIAPYTISSIVVSSLASVLGGRANWGIPKHQAAFTFQQHGKHSALHVADQHGPIGQFEVRSGGPPMPFHTAIIPPPFRTITQTHAGKRFFTRPQGYGWLRPARLLHAAIDPTRFPDITQTQVLLTLAVDSFTLVFPPAYTEFS